MSALVRIPNAELAAITPALAREARRAPSVDVDAALQRMLEAARRRGLLAIELEVRAILETEAAPTRSAAWPSDAPAV